MTDIKKKINDVSKILKDLGEVVVAFSGGKDSFFMMKTAIEVLGKENVKIIFINSDFIAENDKKRVGYFEKKYNLDIIIIELKVLDNQEISKNPENRCYLCKSFIFNNIIEKARSMGVGAVLDGTTFSDLDEFRPGLLALEELKIISPLSDAKITSSEIVNLLKKEDIEEYYLTSSTCLATRFPYNLNLSEKQIRKFDRIEGFLVDNEVYPVRVRYIDEGIRIETGDGNINKILKIKSRLLNLCKKEGMKFITLDLEGLRSGVWDKK